MSKLDMRKIVKVRNLKIIGTRHQLTWTQGIRLVDYSLGLVDKVQIIMTRNQFKL